MLPKKLEMLAAVAREHPDELRADLQEHYGIDLDHARAGLHTPSHVAALVAQLPPGARVRVAYDADAAWTLDAVLMASVRNSLNSLIWGMSDKKTRGPAPAPVGPSWMTRGAVRSLPARAMAVDELLEALGRERI